MPVIKKQVEPIDQQLEYESRRCLSLISSVFCRRYWHGYMQKLWKREAYRKMWT